MGRCVLAELFLDGHALFNLSQLLSYRRGKYSPDASLDGIECPMIKVHFETCFIFTAKALVSSMIQIDPSKRLSAAEYLIQW